MTTHNYFSPFLRLYRHRPTNNKTPKENFITESFAICLFYNTNIAQAFLKEFAAIDTTLNISILTQEKTADGKLIFDLLLTDNRFYQVIVECKFESKVAKKKELGLDQIDIYADFLKTCELDFKKILLIERGAPTKKSIAEIDFTTLRWIDVKVFLETQIGQNPVGEFMRTSFLDLLNYLKVDRKLFDDRLSWKCDLCGTETIGYGIYTHQRKHEKEEKYQKIFNALSFHSCFYFMAVIGKSLF